jgi:hypothetical protein
MLLKLLAMAALALSGNAQYIPRPEPVMPQPLRTNLEDPWTFIGTDLQPESGRNGNVILSANRTRQLFCEFGGDVQTFELVEKSKLTQDQINSGYGRRILDFDSQQDQWNGEVWGNGPSAQRLLCHSGKDTPPMMLVPTRKKK